MGYRFIGIGANDNAGGSVSSAGDVDGDGQEDLIIGAIPANGGTGEIYLISGAALAAADVADGNSDGVIDLGNVADQRQSYRFTGIAPSDYAGSSVSSAGDIDGDGLADLIIGAPGVDNVNGLDEDSGEAYLISGARLAAADAADGSSDGVIDLGNVAGQRQSYRLIGSEMNDIAGNTVSSAGDVDGDGLDDLIIGATGLYSPGETYLISGADLAAADAADRNSDGVIELRMVMDQAHSYQFIDREAEDRAGWPVSSVGDIDGDGLDDLIIGGLRTDPGAEGSGEAYLISGADLAAADATDGNSDGVIDLGNIAAQTHSYRFIGTSAYDLAGSAVSSAGDTDGDGVNDLIIGAFRADGDGSGGAEDFGEAYLISGAGLAAADAADGNSDGVIDLGNVAGQPHSYRFIGVDYNDYAGKSVSSAGDVDGDGLNDLIIGADWADGGGTSSGEAYLISGADLAAADAADGDSDGVIDLGNVAAQAHSYRFIGTEPGAHAGSSLSSAGDADDDGLDDLIIGAPRASGGGFSSGEAYLISGAGLAAADAADGNSDGVIDLANVVQPSLRIGTLTDDDLQGGSSNDELRGLEGNDTLKGRDGADILNGGDGDDFLFGGETEADLRDNIYGGNGNDSIDGGYGNDELRGDTGSDTLIGGFGADTVIGGDDDDVLTGQAWGDLLFGGNGNDFINGGYGYDRANGGDGADQFYHLGVAGHGSDWVQDYDASEGDTLVFGLGSATESQFQINYANSGSGDASVDEAFIIYRPTGQIIWALVDGAGQSEILLTIQDTTYDIMA